MTHRGRVAVVLGAGGVSGWALHMGAAAELRRRGLALTDAAHVVGTSAGAAIAGAVLGGVDPEADVDLVLRPPSDEEQRRYRSQAREGSRGRSWWPAAPGLLRELRPGGRPGLAFAGLVPEGVFPTSSLVDLAGLDRHDGWDGRLWVPAVRLDDGARVVFGRDRTDVTVPDAVAASQAVPLMFRPHRIGHERFVDGAVWSSTHLDLLAGHDVDAVVVVAPMARPGRSAARALARAALRRELATVDRGRTRVALAVPDATFDDRFAGFPRRRPEVRDELVAEGARLVGAALSAAGLG